MTVMMANVAYKMAQNITLAATIEFSRNVVSCIDCILKCVKLQIKIEIKAKLELSKILKGLKELSLLAYQYVKKVNTLYGYGKDYEEFAEIIKQIAQGDSEQLKAFTRQLQRCLNRAKGKCSDWKTKKFEVQDKISSALSNCEFERKCASAKKTATKVVGGTAATAAIGAGVGTGVTLSVVAGVFTFGIGTIVGLGLTAAGAATTGAAVAGGTAVGTHFIAKKFEKLEKSLKAITSSVNILNENTDKMETSLLELDTSIETIDDHIGDCQYGADEGKYGIGLLIKTVNKLQDEFSDLNTYNLSCYWEQRLNKKCNELQFSSF